MLTLTTVELEQLKLIFQNHLNRTSFGTSLLKTVLKVIFAKITLHINLILMYTENPSFYTTC